MNINKINGVRSEYSLYKHCLVWAGKTDSERKLTQKEAKALIKNSGAWMLRNIYDWDCEEQTNFWFIVKDKLAEFDYSSKTRKYIRKANERFLFKLIDKDLLR